MARVNPSPKLSHVIPCPEAQSGDAVAGRADLVSVENPLGGLQERDDAYFSFELLLRLLLCEQFGKLQDIFPGFRLGQHDAVQVLCDHDFQVICRHPCLQGVDPDQDIDPSLLQERRNVPGEYPASFPLGHRACVFQIHQDPVFHLRSRLVQHLPVIRRYKEQRPPDPHFRHDLLLMFS